LYSYFLDCLIYFENNKETLDLQEKAGFKILDINLREIKKLAGT